MKPDLETFIERLDRVEKEVASMREALAIFSQPHGKDLSRFHTDKALLCRLVGEIFDHLDIQDNPVEAEELQKRMGKAGLKANELSEDLIRAREE